MLGISQARLERFGLVFEVTTVGVSCSLSAYRAGSRTEITEQALKLPVYLFFFAAGYGIPCSGVKLCEPFPAFVATLAQYSRASVFSAPSLPTTPWYRMQRFIHFLISTMGSSDLERIDKEFHNYPLSGNDVGAAGVYV